MGQPERAAIRDAVEDLYASFASNQLRPWTDPCLACCATEEEEKALHAVPLRELTIDTMRPYVSNAMMTWGDERDLKCFLPRTLEIVAHHDFNWPDIEVVFAALQRAEWTNWTEDEQRSVRRYLSGKWQLSLSEYPGLHSAEDVICAIARAEDDLGEYLDGWTANRSLSATRHLTDLIVYGVNGKKRRLVNAFWGGNRAQQQEQVLDWLNTEPVVETLIAVATGDAEEGVRTMAEFALDRLPL